MTSKNTKVFWTAEEKRMLAKEMDLIIHFEPGVGHSRALERAMEKLPVDRQRAVKYWALVRSQLEGPLEVAKTMREKAMANINAEQVEEEKRVEDRLSLWMAESVEMLAPFVCKLLDHPDVRNKFRELAQISANAQPVTTGELPQPRVSRPFKLKMVIAGLLPAQSEEIKKSFAADAELRFWRSDESKDQLRALVKNCDVAIGMTDFISHPADHIMAGNASRYVRHSGGIARLKDTVAAALQHQVAEAVGEATGK